jgi:hypothetical protein
VWQNPGVSNKPKSKTMKATETTARQFDAAYFAAQVVKTRKFGHTYIHAGAPHEFQHQDITFRVTGYGRSLEGNGHKYKVHATRDGKPVPTAILRTFRALRTA